MKRRKISLRRRFCFSEKNARKETVPGKHLNVYRDENTIEKDDLYITVDNFSFPASVDFCDVIVGPYGIALHRHRTSKDVSIGVEKIPDGPSTNERLM